MLFTFCASKANSTMTRIKEGYPLHLNILNFHFLISLTSQIPVFVGLIIFDIWSWFNITLLPTCQGRLNLIKNIRNIINRGSVRLISNKIRVINGLHVWDPLVDGPVRLMVQMERAVRELFKSSSLYRIQPVQPKIQQSGPNKRNCEVHAIRKVSPLVQWYLTYQYDRWFRKKEPRVRFTDLLIFPCVVDLPIRPVVQIEITGQDLSRSFNISLCGQCTNATDGLDGKSSARELFRYSNISLCGKHTDTTDVSGGKSSTAAF